MNKKHNVFLLLAIVLFSLVLLTSMVSGGILAKYVHSDNSDDGARVAEFNIDLELIDGQTSTEVVESIDYQFVPGSSVTLDINVDATSSEVVTKCTIKIETLNSLPLNITYNGSDIKTSGITKEISIAGSLNINDITISWDSDDNSYLYSGLVDILTVTITVTQLD